MDVQLPDGTVVKNVPEGTTRSQLMARVQKMSPEAFKEIKDEGNVVRPPQMMTPSGEKPELSYSNPDLLRGHPLVRFAEGAASPILGAGQLTANLVGAGGPVNRFLSGSEEQAQQARAQLGSEGVDFWKLGGTVMSPAVEPSAQYNISPEASKILSLLLNFFLRLKVGASLEKRILLDSELDLLTIPNLSIIRYTCLTGRLSIFPTLTPLNPWYI